MILVEFQLKSLQSPPTLWRTLVWEIFPAQPRSRDTTHSPRVTRLGWGRMGWEEDISEDWGTTTITPPSQVYSWLIILGKITCTQRHTGSQQSWYCSIRENIFRNYSRPEPCGALTLASHEKSSSSSSLSTPTINNFFRKFSLIKTVQKFDVSTITILIYGRLNLLLKNIDIGLVTIFTPVVQTLREEHRACLISSMRKNGGSDTK